MSYAETAVRTYTENQNLTAFAIDDQDIREALCAVTDQWNWFNEQDCLLVRYAKNRDAVNIRAWAQEMREDMPDNDAWPQEFCNAVAESMDELAAAIEAIRSIDFVERGNGFPREGDILIDHEDETAYRVLDGLGTITTGPRSGDPDTCKLAVEEVDYDDYCDYEFDCSGVGNIDGVTVWQI